MIWFWKWLVSVLVWLSADQHQLNTEPARCAAAVASARATMVGKGPDRLGVEKVEEVKPAPVCVSGTCPQRTR
jgi:hypothetical protein